MGQKTALRGFENALADRSTDPVFMKIGAEYFWYHNDHLGTPQMMTTTSGAVVWSAKYSSFGKADVDQSSAVVNPLRFPGQYEDSETGLHYNWWRYYDSTTGRYLRSDPIGFWGGMNFYAYVQNNPVNFVDPYGLRGGFGIHWKNPFHPYFQGIKAEEMHFPRDPDPYSGGYRHCVSACLAKKMYGSNWARILWDFFKEDPNKYNDSCSDMAAEKYGEVLADDGQNCEIGCMGPFPPYDSPW